MFKRLRAGFNVFPLKQINQIQIEFLFIFFLFLFSFPYFFSFKAADPISIILTTSVEDGRAFGSLAQHFCITSTIRAVGLSWGGEKVGLLFSFTTAQIIWASFIPGVG